jgi:hypothetical protein
LATTTWTRTAEATPGLHGATPRLFRPASPLTAAHTDGAPLSPRDIRAVTRFIQAASALNHLGEAMYLVTTIMAARRESIVDPTHVRSLACLGAHRAVDTEALKHAKHHLAADEIRRACEGLQRDFSDDDDDSD